MTAKQHLGQHPGADVNANHAARGHCLRSQLSHQACTAVGRMTLVAVQAYWNTTHKLLALLQAPKLLWPTCAGSNVQYILPSLEACPLYKLLCYRKMPLAGLCFICACAAPGIKYLQDTLGEADRIKDPQWLLLGAHGG